LRRERDQPGVAIPRPIERAGTTRRDCPCCSLLFFGHVLLRPRG
jgi:hypothetical protein